MLYPKNSSNALAPTLFANPTSEYRGTPFWSWNNDLKKEQLLRQIEQMKQMGLGGFHMHPRTGLSTTYLGDEFMELIRECVEKARSEDMLAWLYDEDRWPSGAAGGLVTKEAKYRARYLCFTADAMEGQELARYEVELDEQGGLASYRRLAQGETGANVWYAYLLTQQESPWYNNQTYVDTLNPEAIAKFIEITYERYLQKVGADFGGVIPAIFTDEPQFTRKSQLGFAKERKAVTLPWTPDFAVSYAQAFGADPLDSLPEIIWDLPGGAPSVARYRYHDHVAERFATAFADQCGAWCAQHNLMLTGHMMEEPTLHSQTSAIGDAMRSYRAFQLPGIDMLCDRREYTTAKQAQSVSRQDGRPGVLSELYGVTNWDFDFRGHKLQGDWQAALGVTVRVHHLNWVSMQGEAKRDYPAAIGYQSPWYKEYALVEDHFSRLNTALTRGKAHVRVAAVHPVESYWLKFGPNEQSALIREEMDKRFRSFTEWMLFGQVDFDFLAESLLPTQCPQGASPLKVGQMEYEAVLVPWCETIRSSTLDRLEAFRQAGGRLIFMGEAPRYVDAQPSERARKLAEQSEVIGFDRASLLFAVEPHRDVEIRMENGSLANHLLYQMRNDGDGKFLFIGNGRLPANPDLPHEERLTIRVRGQYRVTLYDTMTGEISPFASTLEGGNTVLIAPMFMHDSLLLRLDELGGAQPAQAEGKTKERYRAIVAPPRMDDVEIELSEPNVLLLDMAEYRLDERPWEGMQELLIADNACRAELGWPKRSNHIAQPWVVPKEPITHTFHARFTIYSDLDLSGVRLAVENAAQVGIRFNGEVIKPQVDGWYVDESIHTVPLPTVCEGENILELSIPFGKRTGVEWCYLVGDFGVEVAGNISILTAPVTTLAFGDYTRQGLPFYGGNVTYKLPVATQGGDLRIHAPHYRGALIGVTLDGKRVGSIVYAPYDIVLQNVPEGEHEVGLILFGSRINSFGQVHNADETMTWFGPDSWRTQGDSWTYEYRLHRMGILTNPALEELE